MASFEFNFECFPSKNYLGNIVEIFVRRGRLSNTNSIVPSRRLG